MKHSEEEPLNLGWLADRGAREAPLDSQGFLKEEPKRDSVSTDRYDLLLKGLYEAGRRLLCYDPLTDEYESGINRCLAGLAKVLEEFDKNAAHQLREGMRDAGNEPARLDPDFGTPVPACLKCGAIKGEPHSLISCFDIPPTEQPTTKAGFTEEEIAVVKAWCAHLDITFAEASARPFWGIPIWPNLKKLSKPITKERCRAIAEHLAREGE